MQTKPSNQDEISDVNIVPLADVCLVLVIIILVISPMSLQSMIQVQASQALARSSQKAEPEKPLFVDVTTKGFTLNNKLIGTEYELYRLLQRELSAKRDKTVLITSAGDVRYESVVRVLDIVKQSGAKSLSLTPRKKVA